MPEAEGAQSHNATADGGMVVCGVNALLSLGIRKQGAYGKFVRDGLGEEIQLARLDKTIQNPVRSATR